MKANLKNLIESTDQKGLLKLINKYGLENYEQGGRGPNGVALSFEEWLDSMFFEFILRLETGEYHA